MHKHYVGNKLAWWMSHPAGHFWKKYIGHVPSLLPPQFSSIFSSFRKGRRFSQTTTSPTVSVSSASMVSRWVSQPGPGLSSGRRVRAGESLIQTLHVSLQEKEAFTKTPCYHYFHCHCLARYIQHMEQELKTQGQEQERQHAVTKQVDMAGQTHSLACDP